MLQVDTLHRGATCRAKILEKPIAWMSNIFGWTWPVERHLQIFVLLLLFFVLSRVKTCENIPCYQVKVFSQCTQYALCFWKAMNQCLHQPRGLDKRLRRVFPGSYSQSCVVRWVLNWLNPSQGILKRPGYLHESSLSRDARMLMFNGCPLKHGWVYTKRRTGMKTAVRQRVKVLSSVKS